MFKSMKSRFGAAAIVVCASVLAGMAVMQDDDAADQQKATNGIRIATFEPQAVFQQYYGFAELVALSQRLEAEAQQAQMQGDQQRLMELNQQMQDGQTRIVNRFQEDIDRVVPEVAREHNFDLVALEVVYVRDDIQEAQDITEQVVIALNADAPESDANEQFDPFAPAQPEPATQE